MLTLGSLFSGIGGFELGLERTGEFETVWQCEKDEFCLKVLEKYWPDVKRFTDIHEMKGDIPYVDVICGGFPCQPVSCAGKGKGKEDERWLWPEFYRIVCQVRPRWVLVENVPGLLSADSGRLFAGILRDLASSGYDAEWNIVSAASVGAPHLRKRVFIVAYTVVEAEPCKQKPGCPCPAPGEVSDTHPIGRHGGAGMSRTGGRREFEDGGAASTNTNTDRRATFGGLGIFANGISCRLDDYWSPGWEDGTPRLASGQKDRVNRLKALGNAIVPQCAEFVGRCILADEQEAGER